MTEGSEKSLTQSYNSFDTEVVKSNVRVLVAVAGGDISVEASGLDGLMVEEVKAMAGR